MEPDGQLVLLVSILNHSGAGSRMSLTVWTGGAVITGMAISTSDYWRLMADAVRTPDGGDGSPVFDEIWTTWADREATAAIDPEPPEDELLPEAIHLHLLDAQVVVGGNPVGRQMLWRARLASIDGWTLTSFQPLA